jgi:hypothetical protein
VTRFALLTVVLTSCSSPARHDYPKLSDGDAPETKPVAPIDAAVAPPSVLYEPGGASCMPPGVYDVELDLRPAKLTVLGQDEAFCRSMLEAVPKNILAQLKVEIENGALAVYWPTKVVTISASQCEFAITSQPVLANIVFTNGNGTGTADYAVGAQNHPGEKCEAKGAKLTLVRASS